MLKKFKNILKENRFHWQETNDNHHLGNNVDEVHNKLISLRDTNFSKPENYALHEYSNYSYDLNESLLKHHKSRKVHPKDFEGFHLPHLDSALNRNKLNHDLHVYSGVSFDPEHETTKNGLLHLPSYSSTSIDKSVAAGFSIGRNKHNCIIHFHLNHNQHGLYLGDLSSKPYENEFILPRGQTIHIHNIGKPEYHDIYDPDKQRSTSHRVYHASILKD